MTESGCRPAEDGYLLNGEHYDGCDDPGCLGCFPCVPRSDNGTPLHHCTGRTRCTHHIDTDVMVCPRCVGIVRQALTDIERLYALLPEEAIHQGVDSEAANLAGPADPIGWSERKIHAIANGYPVSYTHLRAHET